METARKIKVGDAEYAGLFSTWTKNQRSAQFDTFGDFGGAIIHAHNRGAANTGTDWVEFFIHASVGPTTFSDDNDGGPITNGWIVQVPFTGRVIFKKQRYGKLTITKESLPRETITLA